MLAFPIPNMSISKIENWLDALQPDGIILSGVNDFGEYQDRDLLEFHLLSLVGRETFQFWDLSWHADYVTFLFRKTEVNN